MNSEVRQKMEALQRKLGNGIAVISFPNIDDPALRWAVVQGRKILAHGKNRMDAIRNLELRIRKIEESAGPKNWRAIL